MVEKMIGLFVFEIFIIAFSEFFIFVLKSEILEKLQLVIFKMLKLVSPSNISKEERDNVILKKKTLERYKSELRE